MSIASAHDVAMPYGLETKVVTQSIARAIKPALSNHVYTGSTKPLTMFSDQSKLRCMLVSPTVSSWAPQGLSLVMSVADHVDGPSQHHSAALETVFPL